MAQTVDLLLRIAGEEDGDEDEDAGSGHGGDAGHGDISNVFKFGLKMSNCPTFAKFTKKSKILSWATLARSDAWEVYLWEPYPPNDPRRPRRPKAGLA